ncbi:MAG: hypothetical protein ABSA47_00995 [Verrucomicrobiota bacterium]
MARGRKSGVYFLVHAAILHRAISGVNLEIGLEIGQPRAAGDDWNWKTARMRNIRGFGQKNTTIMHDYARLSTMIHDYARLGTIGHVRQWQVKLDGVQNWCDFAIFKK